jgi:HAD superfamily hydrolase (TIGR01549 family)
MFPSSSPLYVWEQTTLDATGPAGLPSPHMNPAYRDFDSRKIKGVFFDLYGTLFVYQNMKAVSDGWFRSLFDGLTLIGKKADEDEAAEASDGFFSWPVDELKGASGSMTVYERRIRLWCGRLGLKMSKAETTALAESSIAAANLNIRFDEQAYAVLKELKGRKKLALITNFDHPPHVYKLAQEYALDRFFEIITISGEVGIWKPDPRIFALTLEKAGLKPNEVVYIGDSEEDDIKGARAAGLFPILIRRGGKKIHMDYDQSGFAPPDRPASVPFAVITSLTELFKYL